MSKIGRNDPCPCGSGKKHKRCCADSGRFASIPPELIAARLAHERDGRLVQDILSWVEEALGPAALEEAHDLYDDWGEAVLDEHEGWLEDTWLAYSYQDEDGRSFAARFLDAHPRLPEDDLIHLIRQMSCPLSLYQVVSTVPKRSLELLDRLTLETHTVVDNDLSQALVKHDCILGRVLHLKDVSTLSGLHPRALPPELGEQLVAHVRKRLSARKGRRVTYAKWYDLDNQLDLLRDWRVGVEAVDNRPPPQLCNTDGQPVLITRDHFDLDPTERPRVLRGLLALEWSVLDTEEGAVPAQLSFIRPGNAVHKSWQNTVVGSAELGASRLVLETNSPERADLLRVMVTGSLGRLIRHRLRDHQDPTSELLTTKVELRGPAHGSRSTAEIPAEVMPMLRKMREDYMRDWMDLELPALDGLSAREAAKSKKGRERLEVLIKGMENMEARRPLEERIDLSEIRAELGLS